MFIIGLIFFPVAIGCFLIWLSLQILDKNSKNTIGFILLAVGNLSVFFPLSLAVLGASPLTYFLGTLVSFGVSLFLINGLDNEGEDEDNEDDDYEEDDYEEEEEYDDEEDRYVRPPPRRRFGSARSLK